MSTLPQVTAEDIWMNAGPNARAGFPLPNGHLPIPLPITFGEDAICTATPEQWQAYRDLSSFTQRTPD